MWHTTNVWGDTLHLWFCIMQQTLSCGRSWLVYNFSQSTHPFYSISCKSLLSPKHVIWRTHSNISCRVFSRNVPLWDIHDMSSSWHKSFKTHPPKEDNDMCFPLSAHSIHSEVAMVTILWLSAIIRTSLKINQKLWYSFWDIHAWVTHDKSFKP